MQKPSDSSKATDSGYGGMDSREDPKASDPLPRSKLTSGEESKQKYDDRDLNSNNEVIKDENEGRLAAKNKASRVPSSDERRGKEVNRKLKSDQKFHDGRKPQEGKKSEDDGRVESSDRQVRMFE